MGCWTPELVLVIFVSHKIQEVIIQYFDWMEKCFNDSRHIACEIDTLIITLN